MKLVSINAKHVRRETVAVVYNKDTPCAGVKDTNNLITAYPDRFVGLGKFLGTAKLQLKDDYEPVVHAPRRCPIHLKKDIQTALDDMEQQEIIEKIPTGQPTEWLSSLAYVCKSNWLTQGMSRSM